MAGYAVKPNGSWRAVDTDTMPLSDDETFQEKQPPVLYEQTLQ